MESEGQCGTRTQPYGLRVQRIVSSTACMQAHYLGDIVISRTKGDASMRRGKKRAATPLCILTWWGYEMESLRASYVLYKLTCSVNPLYSFSLLSKIRPSPCDPSWNCVISVVYLSPSNNPGTQIYRQKNWNIGKSMLIEQLYSIHLGQNFTGYERFVVHISFNKYTKLMGEILGNTF